VESILVFGSCAWSFAGDAEPANELNLADLAAYRAALSGKATTDHARASDPPVQVSFRDLWNHSEAFRGRRVQVQGRVERIFRQGPIGSFPSLAEIWIAAPTGDPFCLVLPQESGTGRLPASDHDPQRRATPQQVPKLGQMIRFTGTFLKTIRYAAGDGARLAPLVVGNQPPLLVREGTKANGVSSYSVAQPVNRWAGLPASSLLGLALAILAAGVLASRHLHLPSRQRKNQHRDRSRTVALVTDPPLEFIEPHDGPDVLD
jgi:hypothetical protein